MEKVSVPTCVIDSVPHLVTVDAAGLVGVIMFKDSLKRRPCLDAPSRRLILLPVTRGNVETNLPLFDLVPQVSELLKVESPGPVHLKQTRLRPELNSRPRPA